MIPNTIGCDNLAHCGCSHSVPLQKVALTFNALKMGSLRSYG
jgi:hypothetical protein